MAPTSISPTTAYWRTITTALQAQIRQRDIVAPEHLSPLWIDEYVGTGHGAPRFQATTATEPGHGWQRVARVDPDGTVAVES